MLFNSYEFVLVFLPVTLLGFYMLGPRRPQLAIGWTVLCSLFFYAYWRPPYLLLLVASIAFNYVVGRSLMAQAAAGAARGGWLLALGVAGNLAALGYFKYTNFLIDNVNAATGADIVIETIILPLGISFYTFQQIAYLVDAARGETHDGGFLRYALFVAFFPQLIAGPIVNHRDVLRQFSEPRIFRFDHDNIAAGLTFFAIGLFKKVVLADSVGPYARPVFAAAAEGEAPSLIEAWGGALAYTLQLYFDFSGYCDMAVGLGLMFNIRLPVNFNSPYRAANIIDFWRRWHITLSSFLRDYLYIALGGNRRGAARRYANLLMTMILGGIWHGAGWTFALWGVLHGVYLVINHAWHAFRRRAGFPPGEPHPVGAWLGRATTLLAVIVGWVLFRAESLDAARLILAGMIGLNGLTLPPELAGRLAHLPIDFLDIEFARLPLFDGPPQAAWMAALFAIALFLPNSQQLVGYVPPNRDAARIMRVNVAPLRLRWTPTHAWAGLVAASFIYSLTQMSGISEFLYFQF